MDGTPGKTPGPEQMRTAMAAYVTGVHESYVQTASILPPAVRGSLPLLQGHFTVVAAGVGNLHVIGTREAFPPPTGLEVAIEGELPEMTWTLRFFDPVVAPELGLIDETSGEPGAEVRRVLGLSTHLYHLVVQPGAALGPHHAGHTGTGLANAHAAAARDFETLRHLVTSRIGLIDEMQGAATAGLSRAQALLAREVAPQDAAVADLAGVPRPDPTEIRRTLIAAVRTEQS
ncbi:MAG: hypothetical protein U9O63_07630 [Actinomycetota bacterium]|nr:hypothetical protein [Actinomycetota bacterium]